MKIGKCGVNTIITDKFKMKYILIALLAMFSYYSSGQVLNGSFENNGKADLSYWEWTCGADSIKNAPPGGGNWSTKVEGGNFQGCFPGYAYQKIPSVANGQTYLLSGMAFTESSIPVGIYFGKIKNGIITTHTGDTTSSKAWTQLSIQSNFELATGDTACVVLHGGTTTGPFQTNGYFDLINLQLVNHIASYEKETIINIYPMPFSVQTTLQTSKALIDATLTLYNSVGQQVKQVKHINGKTINLQRDYLQNGAYFVIVTQNNQFIAKEKLIVFDN